MFDKEYSKFSSESNILLGYESSQNFASNIMQI